MKSELVCDIVQILKLNKAQNNYVGSSEHKGISGGEKRRLNIGFELLLNPRILFLDEPTSGLDSYTAFIIVKLMKELASARNIVVVYTIHQPSVDMFRLFDKLMILNKGKITYFGEAKDSVDYYANLGFVCSKTKNPLDFFLDLTIKTNDKQDQ